MHNTNKNYSHSYKTHALKNSFLNLKAGKNDRLRL